MAQIIENVLSNGEAQSAFQMLKPDKGEVQFGQYYALTDDKSLVRLPRLIAFQASINEFGDCPWYRCTIPSVPQNKIVYMPWTPTVAKIKQSIETLTGNKWNLAHIIYYKDGDESMGMHSDTVLDLEPGSTIAIFSLGSTRQLDLVKKTASSTEGPDHMRFGLMDNSLFLLDEHTNKHYVHGIRKQKKNQVQDRVSIVFRNVITYKTDDDTLYGRESAYFSRQEIAQYCRNMRLIKHMICVVLVMFGFWLQPFSNFTWPSFGICGLFWLLLNLIIDKVARVIQSHQKTSDNRRLQQLCHRKNFNIWDQTDMKKYLNYE